MKTAFALVFLAVCFSAQASKLADIDASAFGKNLLDTVFLEFKTGDNAQTVIELLNDVEKEVVEEQQAHDARHTEYQTSCDADITEYNDQITRAQNDEAAATEKLNVAYPLRTQLEASLEENKGALAETEEALRVATALIEEQREAFHTHEGELIDAIQVFNAATGALKTSFGVSFLQTGSSLAQHLTSVKLNAKYAPFARILAQAATSNKLSQSAIDNILSLLQRLISNAQNTLSSERQTMQDREDAFETYSGQLEDAISNYHQIIAEIEGKLQIVNDNIQEWEGNLADAQLRFATYTQKLADRTAICDEEDREYAEATAHRNSDIAIIGEVRDLISNRVADFTQYITSTREDIHID